MHCSRSPGRGRPSGRSVSKWLISGVVLAVLIGAAAVAFLRNTPGPQSAPVSEIEHIHGLAVDPSDPRVLWIGTHGGLIRVTDGREWVRVGRQTYDMMGLTLHPTAPGMLLTSGHPGPTDRRPDPLGVEVSRDRGQTWRPLALAGRVDFHALAISRVDPRVLYGWNVAGRTGLYRSRDGGRTWQYLGNRGLESVFSLAAHSTIPTVVFAGTNRGLFLSEDTGETWRPADPVLSGVPVTVVEVHPKNPQIVYLYALNPELGLIRSDDGARQGRSIGFFLGDQDAVESLVLDPDNPEVVYFATFRGNLYRSADGGRTREPWVSRGKVIVR